MILKIVQKQISIEEKKKKKNFVRHPHPNIPDSGYPPILHPLFFAM